MINGFCWWCTVAVVTFKLKNRIYLTRKTMEDGTDLVRKK